MSGTATSTRSTTVGEPTGRGGRVIALAAALGLVVLVLALLWGGGAPQPVPEGLPDSGPVTGWGLPVATFVLYGAATLCIGSLVAAACLAPSSGRRLTAVALRALAGAWWWALLWAAAAVVVFVLTLSDILGEPVGAVLDDTTLVSFGWQIPQGQALVVVAALALVVAACTKVVRTLAGALVLAALGVVAVLPPAFTGHSAQAGAHDVAISSLVTHVVGACLWIGGVAATVLYLRRRDVLPFALQRFSHLGLWCFFTVALSGVVNAWVRLGSVSAFFTTSYGILVLGKVTALVVLAGIGATFRYRLIGRLRSGALTGAGAVRRLVAVETVVMGVTLGLAVSLSRTPTPEQPPLSRLQSLLGYDVLPFTWARLFTQWRPDTVAVVTAVTVLVWYLGGVLRLRRAGVPWPVLRTLSFVAGVLVTFFMMCSGVMTYGPTMFSVHMISHMVLTMVTPILLALGMPFTLALRALPASGRDAPWGAREWLLLFLQSRYFRFLTHPVVAFALYVSTLYLYYLTPLFEASQEDHVAHMLVQLHFLLVGCLFFFVVLGLDPMPRKVPVPARMVMLVASMPFHAFFAITILTMPTVLAQTWYDSLGLSWVPDRLADQRLGGGVAWVFAELPSLAVLAVLFVQWYRSDEREARARERRIDAGTDHSLEEYNAYLARLAEQERREK